MSVNSLFEKAKTQGRQEGDALLLKNAYTFAENAHRGQKRKSGEPYITHPLATAERLLDMRLDTATVAAALLHDVCEDTEYALDDIKKNLEKKLRFLWRE